MVERRYPLGEALNFTDEEKDAMAFNTSPEVLLRALQQCATDDEQAGRAAYAVDPPGDD